MTESEEGAMIHGFYEFTGQEDQTWTPYKVKELLKGLIKSKFLYSVEEVVLESMLQERGLLNLHNRHDDFFQNRAKASRTADCATAVGSYEKKLTENNVNIKFKEGILNIKLDTEQNIFMTGTVSDIKNIKIEI